MLFNTDHFSWATMALTFGMTGLTSLLGGWDTALQVFITFVILDLIAGVLKGFIIREFSSRRMREGLVTKFGYFIVIVLTAQLDKVMPEDMPVLRTLVVFFYIITEASSILENLAIMGVPVPKFITDRLAQVREREENSSHKG